MQYDFLEQFPRRMKAVGRYAVLLRSSMNKQVWKQYGFQTSDEQINLIFAVLLYIMEQSLKNENCTVDDIGVFIDDLNGTSFHKSIGYDDCRELADFILNVILSNEGQSMSFAGYDFAAHAYWDLPISYVNNRVVYTDGDIKRTSYHLTEDGYSLVLSTLEIEDNLKLPVHEMIFELHLKKQSYDKAVEDIRHVFQLLQIQLRKIQDAMIRIRRNALNYSVEEYEKILNENLDTVSDTKEKFTAYRRQVRERTREMSEMNIQASALSEKEARTYANLRIIDDYLGRALEEQQKILGSHLDLKSLYTRELEQLTQMSTIRRFSLTSDLYDKVLDDPSLLDRMDLFLRPLFCRELEKIYMPDRAAVLQKPIRARQSADDMELIEEGSLEGDEAALEKRREKRRAYRQSLEVLLAAAEGGKQIRLSGRGGKHRVAGSCTMQELAEACREDADKQKKLIPDADLFKEIMVELLKGRSLDLNALREERRENLQEESHDFSLQEMLLDIADEAEGKRLYMVEAMKIEDGSMAIFYGVSYRGQEKRDVFCSNVMIRVRWEDLANGL